MLLATLVAILFVPMLYVSIERLFARKPMPAVVPDEIEPGVSAS